MRVWKPLCSRHSVKIMTNGINAGIICKSLFGKNVESPEAGFGNRPARCAITGYWRPSCVFNRVFGLPRILAEFVRREAVYGSMPIAMAGKLMPARLYFAHQMRKSFGYPADKEKRSLGMVLVKEIKHTVSVRDHAGRPPVPSFAVN